MACSGNSYIPAYSGILPDVGTPTPEENLQRCLDFRTYLIGDFANGVNNAQECMNSWHTEVQTWHGEVQTWHGEVESWKNQTWTYREEARVYADNAEQSKDDAQTIVDGISGQLPEGTISDETVATQTTWSSYKIRMETQTQGIASIVEVDGNVTEVVYQDGAKTLYTYDENDNPITEVYTETDGTTPRMTYTYSWDENGNFISMVRS